MPDRPERDRDLDALKSSVRAFAEKHHARRAFEPGVTPVPVTGKVFDHEEFELLLEAGLDGWWTEGRFTQQVAADLAGFLGARDVMLCNSGNPPISPASSGRATSCCATAGRPRTCSRSRRSPRRSWG